MRACQGESRVDRAWRWFWMTVWRLDIPLGPFAPHVLGWALGSVPRKVKRP